ncbi:unnamed protein product [Prunus armeniaca]
MCSGDREVRCVKRNLLLEALANELPNGTVRFSSKVVSIDESGYFKLVHLADGTILKAKVDESGRLSIIRISILNLITYNINALIEKVLVGCDGLNSVVTKWLGFKQPAFTGRSAIGGRADFKRPHGFDPIFMRFFGNGVRSGVIPCDDKTVYTWVPSSQGIIYNTK